MKEEKDNIIKTQVLRLLQKSLRVGELMNWPKFEKKYIGIQKEMKELFSIPENDTGKELTDFKEFAELLKQQKMLVDSISYMQNALNENKRVMLEGGEMLGLDYGTYPYTEGYPSAIATALISFGISPSKIDTRIGVLKAYCTRTDEGPFPSELKTETEHLMKKGKEFYPNRKRRCGWLDLNIIKLAHMMNNYSSLVLTKLDVLDELPEIKVAVGYRVGDCVESNVVPDTIEGVECVYQVLQGWMQDTSKIRSFKELPRQAKAYVKLIENTIGIPVAWIGVGESKEQIIRR